VKSEAGLCPLLEGYKQPLYLALFAGISKSITTMRKGIKQLARIFYFWLIASLVQPIAASDLLQVSIPTTVSDNLPQITDRIIRALSTTDLEIEFKYLPNKRSLLLLNEGKIALEFFRAPIVGSQYPDLIRLEPPMRSLQFKMITSNRTPEFCKISESDYRNMSIGGVRGWGLNQVFFYPKFKTHTIVGDLPSTARFVALQRADVSFFPAEMLDTVPNAIMVDLVVCDTHFKVFNFHPHLHKDFSWAKEKLEKALKSEFGG
jgi:hypothetical protein